MSGSKTRALSTDSLKSADALPERVVVGASLIIDLYVALDERNALMTERLLNGSFRAK